MKHLHRILLIALGTQALTGCTLSITQPPEVEMVSATSVNVRWTTNRRASAQVWYGIEGAEHVASSPIESTEHSVLLENLEPGMAYEIQVVSRGADETASDNWFAFIPEDLVLFIEPSRPWVTGNAPLQAATADVALEATQAEFFVRSLKEEKWKSVGIDRDGTDDVSNTFRPAPTGDGWHVTWDTRSYDEGLYLVRVVFKTRLGPLEAVRPVYVDPSPPTAKLESPTVGKPIGNLVRVTATRSHGRRAVFEQRRGTTTYQLPGRGLKQHDFPFDGGKGATMCDPTAEASILWSYEWIRNWAQRNKLTLRKFVRLIAQVKGTKSPKGTTQDGERKGWLKLKGYLKEWTCSQIGRKQQSMTLVEFKRVLERETKRRVLKGAMVHIKPAGRPHATGHLMVVKRVVDKPDGTATMTFMDPDTGKDLTRDVDKKGRLQYGTPPANYQLQWGNVITGPENATASSSSRSIEPSPHVEKDDRPWRLVSNAAPNAAEEVPWTLIAVDEDPADGWHANWDTSDLKPGPWWVRVTVVDDQGHTDSDAIEVWKEKTRQDRPLSVAPHYLSSASHFNMFESER